MKIVINTTIGGFRPSNLAVSLYYQAKNYQGEKLEQQKEFESDCVYFIDPKDPRKALHGYSNIPRNDPMFVDIVEKLGEKANTDYCELKVVDIPDGVDYIICSNEMGEEWIAEKHRTWD